MPKRRRVVVRLTEPERRSLSDRIRAATDVETLQGIAASFEHLPEEDVEVSALRLLIDLRRLQLEEDGQPAPGQAR